MAVGALFILYTDISSGVISAIKTALTATSTPLSGGTVVRSLKMTRTREMATLATLISLVAVLFGYLIGRLALQPTRTALAAQKQFIGNIAHELRTPLSIIKTNTEVRLMDADVPPPARAAHLSNLEELDRISDIINNLLSLNSLVRPERIPFGNVDMLAVANRVVEKLARLVRKKPVEIRVHAARERTVWGNASAIEQMLTNVVRNAISYTAAGEVTLTIGPGAHDTMEIAVRDTGTGIKREDLFRIFEPFYRGDRARSRAGGAGSGLGLAIVNELVKMHHGRISVKSAPGKGTTVTIVLPAGRGTRPSSDAEQTNEISADFSNGRR